MGLGGADHKYYDDPIVWHKLHNQGAEAEYWTIKMDDVLINGQPMNACPSTGCYLAVDTGTSLITGPKRHMDKMIDKVDVEADCSNFDSGKLPTLTFKINGQNYDLTPQEYVMKIKEDNSNICIGGF